MFSAFAKIVKRLGQNYRANIIVSLVLAALCIYPINHLRWELQLQDSLKGNEVQLDYQDIENSFGGLGSLTIVLQSKDSLTNFNLACNFARDFSKDPLVHFIEFAADENFFKKNRLLYANEDEVAAVVNMVDSVKNAQFRKSNPFLVDLTESADSAGATAEKADGLVKQIEEKYFRELQQSHANNDGTIRVIDIYPTHSLTDLQSNRNLYNRAKAYLDSAASSRNIEVYYTGKIYKSIKTGKKLLPEAKFAGGMAVIILLVLSMLHFYRRPQLILISGLPIALPTIFMFGIAYLFFGRINLFTLNLALILPGHAMQIQTHLLTRFFQERDQNLSPTLSTESAILGIMPPVAASSLIMAALFLSLLLIPLPGLRELAILGAIGVLMNLYICPLLGVSLLRFAQQKKMFNIAEISRHIPRRLKLFPNKVNWAIIVCISILSSAGLLYSGNNLAFLYDFRQTEMQLDEQKVNALIEETGFSTFDPVIVMLPDSSYSSSIQEDFKHLKDRGQIPDLGRIYTQYQFMPKMSKNKKNMLEHLKAELTPQILSRLATDDSVSIVEMLSNYENDIQEFKLSEDIRRKFSGKDGQSGVFAFIIPSSDPDNGLACRHINAQLQKFDGIQDNKFKVCGTPILRANVLDLVLQNVDKSIVLGIIMLWFILLLYYNKLSRAFFTVLPSMFSMSWLTILVHGWGIHISFYSSLVFVLLIGVSVDGSLQLWSSYYEKQNGTAWTVLRAKLSSILTAQGAGFIGSFAMLLSSHPGIRSMGIISAIGLICIFISQLTIYPLIASTLDTYRVIKKSRLRKNETSIH